MTAAYRRARRPDPFKILGISPTSSPAEITAAYRTLAKKFHPDLHARRGEGARREAEERMALLNEAYKNARDGYRGGADGEGGYGARGGAQGHTHGSPAGPWGASASGPDAWARTAGRSMLQASREQAERAVRQYEAQARSFRQIRNQARQSASYGNAVLRPKSRLVGRVGSTLYGIGQASHSNEVTCRSCKTIQRLPGDWQVRLSDYAFFCSSCDRLLLSR